MAVDQVELARRWAVVKFIRMRKEELRINWTTISKKAQRVDSLIRRNLRDPAKFPITPDTAAGLDRALELEPGSIERMLKGTGDPVRKPGSPGAAPTAPAGAPPTMVDIVRKWNRRLTVEDAAELADDILAIYGTAKLQGYEQGFEDGRAVLRGTEPDPASPSSTAAQA
jgi:hypothetical protein